jgi:uncharacterized membrane protein
MPRRYIIKLIVAILALILGVVFFLFQQQKSREPSGVGDVGLHSPVKSLEQPLHETAVYLNGYTGDVARRLGA